MHLLGLTTRRNPGFVTPLLAVTLSAWASYVAAQSLPEPPDRPPFTVEIASESIRRYSLFATAAGQAANWGADAALDRAFGRPVGRGAGPIASRLARLWLVSMPIAAASSFAAHEMGHVSRAHESGDAVHSSPSVAPLLVWGLSIQDRC